MDSIPATIGKCDEHPLIYKASTNIIRVLIRKLKRILQVTKETVRKWWAIKAKTIVIDRDA